MEDEKSCTGGSTNGGDLEETSDVTSGHGNREKNSYLAKASRSFFDFDSLISVATVSVLLSSTIVTAALWLAQLRSNAISNANYVASTRPWIMLTKVEPVSLTSDNEAGVSFWVRLSVRNVGHSPAQNVSVSARLLMLGFDPLPDTAMSQVCETARMSSLSVLGRTVFPDQVQNVYGETPTGFVIEGDRVWAARAARIKSAYGNSGNRSRQQEQAWVDALAKFPFYAPLIFVGCINYRSSDNRQLFQTSFMFNVSQKNTNESFPLLSEAQPVNSPPVPLPGDPDGVVVRSRESQRVFPGDRIKLGTPLYGTFAY